MGDIVSYAPWLKGVLQGSVTSALVKGALPPTLLWLITWVYPLLLRQVTLWQGATTWIDVDRGMMSKARPCGPAGCCCAAAAAGCAPRGPRSRRRRQSFMFNVIVVFLSTILGGAVFAEAKQFYHNPAKARGGGAPRLSRAQPRPAGRPNQTRGPPNQPLHVSPPRSYLPPPPPTHTPTRPPAWQIPSLLASKVPGSSTFFFTYAVTVGMGTSGGQVARWLQTLLYALRPRGPGGEDGAKWPPEHQPMGRFIPQASFASAWESGGRSLLVPLPLIRFPYSPPTNPVAVTRARRHLCLVGDGDTLRRDPFLARLLAWVERHGEVRSAAELL